MVKKCAMSEETSNLTPIRKTVQSESSPSQIQSVISNQQVRREFIISHLLKNKVLYKSSPS